MKERDVVLCHPVRTAIGTFGGGLKEIPATDLGAAVVRETIRRSEVAIAVGAVIMGNVIQAGNRMNPARQAALHGGVAVSVPALTVNRVCEQDRWAERSQQRFAAAQSTGKFEREIVGIEVASKKGPTVFARDGQPRPDTTVATLAKSRPAFRKDGTITAGNSPGLNSGAAAVVVAERSYAETHGLRPMARLASYGLGAVEPGMFGLGPVPAVHQALERAGWTLSHLDRVATGAALTTRLLRSLTRDGLKRGMVTMRIGGGQGIALTFEIL